MIKEHRVCRIATSEEALTARIFVIDVRGTIILLAYSNAIYLFLNVINPTEVLSNTL